MPCRDVVGRHRDITVFTSLGFVVVTAPPGETAILARFASAACEPRCVTR